jgi:hypothetical protein
MSNLTLKQGRLIIAGLVILLIVLHQDVWFWESRTLVFGFIPVTLFYHVCISIGASATWYLATKIAWPEELEEQSHASTGDTSAEGGQS